MEKVKLKPTYKPKNPQVKDPPRFPKVINGYETIAKRNYFVTMQATLGEVLSVLKK